MLSGSAGAGKTTTIRVLAKEMNIDLLEWGEGADDSSVGSGLGELSFTLDFGMLTDIPV